MNNDEYTQAAEKLVTKIIYCFPSSAKIMESDKYKKGYASQLASAMIKNNFTKRQINRIIYGIENYDSEFVPSVGKVINMAHLVPEPERKANENKIIDEFKESKKFSLTDEQKEYGRKKIAEIIKSISRS